MRKKYLIVISLIVLILIYFLYRGLFVHEKVKTVKIKRGNLITLVYATGIVTADSVATLRSESGGIVKFIAGKEGMFVKKGEILLRTDQKDEALKIRDVENQIEQAQIELISRQRDMERKESLIKTNSITKKEYEDAKQAYELSKVTLQQKKIALDAAKQNITNTEIAAPFSGIIVSLKVNLGDYLAPNADCFEILAPGSILVKGEVDEQDLGKINKGMPSIVAFDAYPDEKFDGSVQRITPKTDETTKTSKVYIKLNKATEKLNLGMTATINIKTGEKDNVLLLPRTAILQDKINSYVFKVKNKHLEKVILLPGQSDGEYAEIPDGKVSEGALVVDQPGTNLKENMKVDIE